MYYEWRQLGIPKQAWEWEPHGTRKWGRPRNTLRRTIENDQKGGQHYRCQSHRRGAGTNKDGELYSLPHVPDGTGEESSSIIINKRKKSAEANCTKRIKQRAVIKFLVAEGVLPHQILTHLQNVFEDECLNSGHISSGRNALEMVILL